jgi:hypothetical protein
MSQEITFNFPGNSRPISPLFWSDLTHKPFESCILCEANFQENDLPYLIEKAVQGFDGSTVKATLFEYAVCFSCADKMHLQLSTDSRLNIARHFKERVDFAQRWEKLKDQKEESWLEECLVNHQALDESGECQLYALCHGSEMIYRDFPYMISAAALDEIMELLSAETLELLNGFKDDLIDLPPELRDLLDKGGPRVLL